VVASVYHVHFQLILMYECYCRLVRTVSCHAADCTQVHTHTHTHTHTHYR